MKFRLNCTCKHHQQQKHPLLGDSKFFQIIVDVVPRWSNWTNTPAKRVRFTTLHSSVFSLLDATLLKEKHNKCCVNKTLSIHPSIHLQQFHFQAWKNKRVVSGRRSGVKDMQLMQTTILYADRRNIPSENNWVIIFFNIIVNYQICIEHLINNVITENNSQQHI